MTALFKTAFVQYVAVAIIANLWITFSNGTLPDMTECKHKFFIQESMIDALPIYTYVCGKCGYTYTRLFVD
jgi:hypothetical protein